MSKSVIVIGNPGVGKSCILNSLASKVLFRSGVSIASGLTYNLEQKIIGNQKYCDTPGLADVRRKKEAGIAIRTSLNMGGPHKILFFCTQKAGRLDLSDKTTIKLVMDAAEQIGPNYGVIVNKISKGMMKKLREDQ